MSDDQYYENIGKQLSERIVQAVADGDQDKAMLAANQVGSICATLSLYKRMASMESKQLRLQPPAEKTYWDHLVQVAKHLDQAISVYDIENKIDAALDDLLDLGHAKVRSPEVDERLWQLRRIRLRMRQFVVSAREFIVDICDLYGCELHDIKRSGCSREVAR